MSKLPAEPPATNRPARSATRGGPRRAAALLALAWGWTHFALGAWVVTLGSYIKANTGDAGSGMFASGFVGIATASGPIGAMVAPFLVGFLADRYFSTERLLVVLNLLAAALLAAAAVADSQIAFHVALVSFFVCYYPTNSLLAAMSMQHLPNPSKHFPLIRGCGTIGWILAGVVVGWLAPWWTGASIESTLVPLKIGVAAQFGTAVLCFWLPPTPPSGALHKLAPSAVAGPQTTQLLRNGPFVAVLVVAFLALIPSPFYYSYVNPFLNWRGMPNPAARMTLGQVVEVACMAALPVILMRIGLRAALLIGIATWGLRYGLLALAAWTGADQWALYVAIAVHGVAYTLVAVSLQLEVEALVDPRRRATAQGLLAVTTSGLGSFVGAQLASVAERAWLPGGLGATTAVAWSKFWLAPTAAALVAVAATMMLLPRRGARSEIALQRPRRADAHPDSELQEIDSAVCS